MVKNEQKNNLAFISYYNNNINNSKTIINEGKKSKFRIPVINNNRISKMCSDLLYGKLKKKKKSLSVPISADETCNNIKMECQEKFHTSYKGLGKHYGNEKDCPICQSMSIKSNYLMKNMNKYIDIKKQKDWNTIRCNKEQFIQDLKYSHNKFKKRTDIIIKEIKDFLYFSELNKKRNIYIQNTDGNGPSFIDNYFDK